MCIGSIESVACHPRSRTVISDLIRATVRVWKNARLQPTPMSRADGEGEESGVELTPDGDKGRWQMNKSNKDKDGGANKDKRRDLGNKLAPAAAVASGTGSATGPGTGRRAPRQSGLAQPQI